jgi:hypothetical protein
MGRRFVSCERDGGRIEHGHAGWSGVWVAGPCPGQWLPCCQGPTPSIPRAGCDRWWQDVARTRQESPKKRPQREPNAGAEVGTIMCVPVATQARSLNVIRRRLFRGGW